jgi:hypothetical protein
MAVTNADLVVEDGTGLSTANVYISLADATEYHRVRGNGLWGPAATENDMCVALIRATQYLDTRWVWTDVRAKTAQTLGFPREEVYDVDGNDVSASVPLEIKDACCEYALAVLGTGVALVELSPTPDQSTGIKVTMQRDKVGSLETETRYDTGVGVRFTVTYPHADRIIKRSGYAINGGGGGGAMR